MRKLKIYFILCLVWALLFSCSNSLADLSEANSEIQKSNMGFCITLPDSTSARAAYYSQSEAVYYKIEVSKDEQLLESRVGKPGETIMISVEEEGLYSINASAYDTNEKLIAEGTAQKEINFEKSLVKFTVIIYPKLKSIDVEVEIVWGTPETEQENITVDYVDIIEETEDKSDLLGDSAYVTMSDNAVYYWSSAKQLKYVKSIVKDENFTLGYYDDGSLFMEHSFTEYTSTNTETWIYKPGMYIIRNRNYIYQTYNFLDHKYHRITGPDWDISEYYKFSGGFGYLSRFTNVTSEEVTAESSSVFSFGYAELNTYLRNYTNMNISK